MVLTLEAKVNTPFKFMEMQTVRPANQLETHSSGPTRQYCSLL